MTQKTSTAQALEVAEERAKYDAEVKNILAEKVMTCPNYEIYGF